MFHGLNNKFLYSAHQIATTFVDEVGNVKVGSGTCFFVENKYGTPCLVTNRHILDISYKATINLLSKYALQKIQVSGKLGRFGDGFPQGDTSFSLVPNTKFSADYENDIGCVIGPQTLDNSDALVDYHLPYSILATTSDFLERLEVCDFLAFPGFPEWYDKRENRPILRTGTISSDPRFDYSYGDLVGGACVAYEAFSYSGSSGSPVFALQKGPKPGPGLIFPSFRDVLLIGINAGHLKASDKTHSGISYFYKSTAILEIIDA